MNLSFKDVMEVNVNEIVQAQGETRRSSSSRSDRRGPKVTIREARLLIKIIPVDIYAILSVASLESTPID